MFWVINDDSRNALRAMPDAYVDSVVCDPPYELGFMGKRWDSSGIAYDVSLWREVLRVLKPGGHLLAFGGTRTYHRMACAIEDAGFDVRDSIHWIYGSGFPKSLDVSKAIDKAAGLLKDEWKFFRTDGGVGTASYSPTVDSRNYIRPKPACSESEHWLGFGTALKPAHEPIVVARKPLDGTVASNVLAHGTGAINVDGCRVGQSKRVPGSPKTAGPSEHTVSLPGYAGGSGHDPNVGRWPPNILLTHSPDCDEACAEGCPVAEMDRQSGEAGGRAKASGPTCAGKSTSVARGEYNGRNGEVPFYVDFGGASRFFPCFRYQAKASRRERGEGNHHPTVKPIELMRWLVRLVTPPGGLVLDPFTGSGSTGCAAVLEGFRFAGVEMQAEYAEIACKRIASREQISEEAADAQIAFA